MVPEDCLPCWLRLPSSLCASFEGGYLGACGRDGKGEARANSARHLSLRGEAPCQ